VTRRRRPSVIYARPAARRRVRRRKNASWDFLSKALAGGAGFLASEKLDSYVTETFAGNEILAKLGPWASVLIKGGLCYLLYKKGGKMFPLPIARAAAIGAGASAVKTIVDQLMSGGLFGGGATAGLLMTDVAQGVPAMGALTAPGGYRVGQGMMGYESGMGAIENMGALEDLSTPVF